MIQLSGLSAAQMLPTAALESDFRWRDGGLKHLALSPGTPLRFTDFKGHLTVTAGKLLVSQSRMASSNGIYQVSGAATFDGILAFTLTQGKGRQLSVSGTLEAPQVALRQQAASSARAVGLPQ